MLVAVGFAVYNRYAYILAGKDGWKELGIMLNDGRSLLSTSHIPEHFSRDL